MLIMLHDGLLEIFEVDERDQELNVFKEPCKLKYMGVSLVPAYASMESEIC